MAEEDQLREDQETQDGTSSITPAGVRASERKYPAIPTTFDPFERLLTWYIRAGHLLFTKRCHHFEEVVRIKQELMLMYRHHGGHLSTSTVTGLLWDIVANASQFFYTFPTVEEFSADPQRSMPTSNLSVRRSLLLVNLHADSLDNPVRWVPKVQTPPQGG